MKKILALTVTLLLAIGLMTACANEPAEPDTSATDVEEEVFVGGMLVRSNTAEEKINADMEELGYNTKTIFYNDLNTMLLALQAGDIDMIAGISRAMADYVVARNSSLAIDPLPFTDTVTYKMAVKADNTDLLESINGALKTLKNKGTLDKLVVDYISAYKTGTDEPAAVEMPVIEGADTVRIAVTGDIPPMDLINADGAPAGFNVALLAEMSKLMNVNFELISMDSAARTMSIATDKVDVIFWVAGSDVLGDYDLPDSLAATDSYYVDNAADVVLAK